MISHRISGFKIFRGHDVKHVLGRGHTIPSKTICLKAEKNDSAKIDPLFFCHSL